MILSAHAVLYEMTAWLSELERMQRTANWHSPWVLHWHCLKGLRKTTKNFRTDGLWTQIWAQDLSNKSLSVIHMAMTSGTKETIFIVLLSTWRPVHRYNKNKHNNDDNRQQQQQSWNIKNPALCPQPILNVSEKKQWLFFLTVLTNGFYNGAVDVNCAVETPF